jgi:HAD superfamily hydrolase (TIGR01509 family)
MSDESALQRRASQNREIVPMLDWGLVIFDNDGVLVDSELLANTALVESLGSFGVVLTVEESMQRYLGSSLESVRQSICGMTGKALPREFEERYHELLFRAFSSQLRTVPGSDVTVETLHRLSVPFCVASSGDHVRIRRALEIVGLLGCFEGRIFSAQDVARGKPAPDLFLYASERMNVEPQRCVVIEDSPAGVSAARAAGMFVIGFAARTDRDTLYQADLICTSHQEVLATLLRTWGK